MHSNTSILLHSGNYFDFLKPETSHFNIEDIAHALSMTCRFNGHCKTFYSVAEHSFIASYLVKQQYAYDALMHDAAEAFTGDIPSPFKKLLGDFQQFESTIEYIVSKRFQISNPLPKEVKHVDMLMLLTEQKLLMDKGDNWNISQTHIPLDITLPCWTPTKAKYMFLLRYHDLAKWEIQCKNTS